MVLFFWSLILCILMTGIILIFLIQALRVNRERKNRHPISFLLPVALTIVFLYLSINLTIPRFLDLVNLLSKTYSIEEIEVPENGLGWNTLLTADHRYFYNQWEIELEDGKKYRIEYTPRSYYLVRATLVETLEVSTRAIGISNETTESIATEESIAQENE
ncbi:MAG: hypothetical protein PHC86_06070 [Eubacteriales bacterium]|nr:hypothetical protein [Eubacteriales bacterium]